VPDRAPLSDAGRNSLDEQVSGDFPCAEGSQVTGVLLAVNLPDAMVAAKTNQRGKRNLGGVSRATEH